MPSHQKPESERFKGPTKWCQYIFARLLVSFLQRLPIGFSFRLGRGIGWLCWKIMKSRRSIVRKNLEIVNAWVNTQQTYVLSSNSETAATNTTLSAVCQLQSLNLEAQVREVFQRAGANLISGFSLSSLSSECMEQHLEVEGIEFLRGTLSRGEGAIMLLAHMGPWEVLAQLPNYVERAGINAPFGSIYRPFNNYYIETWFKSEREKSGTKLFGSRYKFFAPVDFVRAGGLLGVLSDQRASGGELVSFFGVDTKVTPLPGLLHLRTKAPMLALSIETIGLARWRLRLRLIAPQADHSDNSRKALAGIVGHTMEEICCDSVLDVFWFHNRFKSKRSDLAKREP